jgi:hypothetical protein
MPIIDNEDFTRDKEIGIMFNTRIVWHKGDFKLLSVMMAVKNINSITWSMTLLKNRMSPLKNPS